MGSGQVGLLQGRFRAIYIDPVVPDVHGFTRQADDQLDQPGLIPARLGLVFEDHNVAPLRVGAEAVGQAGAQEAVPAMMVVSMESEGTRVLAMTQVLTNRAYYGGSQKYFQPFTSSFSS